MRQRAFTLIELLVVLTIISLLAGMLMPAIARVRRQAWATSCSSRLANIGWAKTMYVTDHGGFLPPMADYKGTYFWGTYDAVTHDIGHSAGYLSEYVDGDADLWQCPALRWGSYMPRGFEPTCSYAYNYEYLTRYEDNLDEVEGWWDPNYKWWYRGRYERVVEKSTSTAVFGDSAVNWLGPLQENWYWTPPSQSLPYGLAYTHFRHDGRANVLWYDGHVSSMPPDRSLPLDRDRLGILCDSSDMYFDPAQ